MSNYELKRFQQKAAKEFERKLSAFGYLETLQALAANPADPAAQREANGRGSDNFVIQVDAPTGAGKTILLGHLAKTLFAGYVHIVFSPGAGNLEEQTGNRLASIVGPGSVSFVDETTFAQPAAAGQIYVGNWEQFVSRDKKTGQYKNRVARDGDVKNFFDWLMELGASYIPVVISIDEAHHGSGSAASSIRSFIADIKDKLGYSPVFVELSATPILSEHSALVKIQLEDVQKEGLIRNSIHLNSLGLLAEVNRLSAEQRASAAIEPFLVRAAIKQKVALDAEYVKVDAHEIINGKKHVYKALIGLQIPNGADGNAALARIEAQLRDEFGITRENGRLVVFMNNDKTDGIVGISSPDSVAEVLIYKQAVATGWDCPRAQILLGFRHITSKIFTKQNLGRFVRTTQQKHYGNELLDNTYVISNVGDLGQASFAKDEVDTSFVYMKESIWKIFEDGHYALSSFNDANISVSHYSRVNQEVIPLKTLRQAWLEESIKAELWNKLGYVNSSELSEMKLAAGSASVNVVDADGVFQLTGQSKAFSADSVQMLNDFQKKLLDVVTEKGRTYGNNAQIARALMQIIIRWYKEMVREQPSGGKLHAGKLKSILTTVEAEIVSHSRNSEPDWNDFAVEQLSVNGAHFASLRAVVRRVLVKFKSVEVQSDQEALFKGSSFEDRKLTSDGTFSINVTEPTWTATSPEAKVTNSYLYALQLAGTDESESYREGPALSGPENSFETKAIPSLVSSAGRTISSFYKSPENRAGAFCLGVSTPNGIVSTFYPDYLGEMKEKNSVGDWVYLPFVLEVKSADEVATSSGKLNNLTNAKAAALVALTASHPGLKAGLAYESESETAQAEWKVIVKVNSDGSFDTVGLTHFLFN